MQTPKLDLLGWGPVESEVLWIEGRCLKIKFKTKVGIYPFIFTKTRTEIFHFNEILNYAEIFIDKRLKIHKYDETK